MAYSARLEAIETEVAEILADLTPRQRKYVLNRSKGLSKSEALLKAGYSKKTAQNQYTAIVRDYRNDEKDSTNGVKLRADRALALICEKEALIHGESIAQHREKLRVLYNHCADPSDDKWDARAAHQIRRTLMEADGHIKGNANMGVSVSIQVVDPVAGITIEGETGPPDSLQGPQEDV